MLKLFNKKKKDNKGFTLVELVVVIAILAILVGLLAPQYTKYVEKARKSSDASNLENMVRAVEVAIADPNDATRVTTGQYTITIPKTGGASVTTGAYNSITPGDDEKKKVENAIKEVIGENWNKTVLKSQNWTNTTSSSDGASATATGQSITAVIKVDTDGSFSVEYTPSELVGMIGTK